MSAELHVVVETAGWLAAAKAAEMTEAQRAAVVDLLAADPRAGEPMEGTGGCRKLRVARPGSGKSGGYRVITFYTGPQWPVFLPTVFGKNEKANLTKAERNALGDYTRRLIAAYGTGKRP